MTNQTLIKNKKRDTARLIKLNRVDHSYQEAWQRFQDISTQLSALWRTKKIACKSSGRSAADNTMFCIDASVIISAARGTEADSDRSIAFLDTIRKERQRVFLPEIAILP